MTVTSLTVPSRELSPYVFSLADKSHDFGKRAGVYILVASSIWPNSPPTVLYVGMTEDASSRPSPNAFGHEKRQAAERLGFNAIAFLDVWNKQDRLSIEKQLIEDLNPPLNIQHNALSSLFYSN